MKRNQQPRTPRRQDRDPQETDAGGPKAHVQPLSAVRRRLFGLLLIFVVPFAVLALLEGSLRLINFGHPTSFLLRREIRGQSMLVDNPWFGLSFFPPALARSPNPVSILAEKPPGVFRIFLFGESAALGDPRPAYGVGRYLEILLSERFPSNKFEVVCVAMTAINSHAILPIAKECTQYQGDLWLVYMGNNEFAGPFGANTVFGRQALQRSAVKAFLSLQKTRTGQWLVNAARGLRRSGSSPTSWGGLKMFLNHQLSPADPRRDRVYKNFEGNLEELLDSANHANVPVILSSVASNLKDCSPFGSFVPASTGNASSAELSRLSELAHTNQLAHDIPQAIRSYEELLNMNPVSAEVHFELGQCELGRTNLPAARQHFAQARDLDTLPFRADTKINAIIEKAATQRSGKRVSFVDAERALAECNSSGVSGKESFYEHVHLTPQGNYQLALQFAIAAQPWLPRQTTNQSNRQWASAAVCAQRLGLTDWNRYTILEEIQNRLSEPPFTTQISHASQMDTLTNEIYNLRHSMTRMAADQTRVSLLTAIERRPEDHYLHHNFAEFLMNTGDLRGSAEQMQRVCDLLPDHYSGFFQLGRILARQREYSKAQTQFETALRLRPDAFEVRVELGKSLVAQEKWEEGLEQYEEAMRAHGGNDSQILFLEGDAFARQHKHPQAVTKLQTAVRVRPDFWEAHELLGMELAADNAFAAAQAHFERVVELRPDDASGHLNLGIALARQNRFSDALNQLAITLRLDPENRQAKEFAANVRLLQTQGAGQ